jgi:hypothetical protein
MEESMALSYATIIPKGGQELADQVRQKILERLMEKDFYKGICEEV